MQFFFQFIKSTKLLQNCCKKIICLILYSVSSVTHTYSTSYTSTRCLLVKVVFVHYGHLCIILAEKYIVFLHSKWVKSYFKLHQTMENLKKCICLDYHLQFNKNLHLYIESCLKVLGWKGIIIYWPNFAIPSTVCCYADARRVCSTFYEIYKS